MFFCRDGILLRFLIYSTLRSKTKPPLFFRVKSLECEIFLITFAVSFGRSGNSAMLIREARKAFFAFILAYEFAKFKHIVG